MPVPDRCQLICLTDFTLSIIVTQTFLAVCQAFDDHLHLFSSFIIAFIYYFTAPAAPVLTHVDLQQTASSMQTAENYPRLILGCIDELVSTAIGAVTCATRVE